MKATALHSTFFYKFIRIILKLLGREYSRHGDGEGQPLLHTTVGNATRASRPSLGRGCTVPALPHLYSTLPQVSKVFLKGDASLQSGGGS